MPSWLTLTAEIVLSLSALCALIVLADILWGHPQKMAIMNVVWPITPLYMGPFGLWAYYAIGRKSARNAEKSAAQSHPKPDPQSRAGQKQAQDPSWQSVFTSVTHCGAGCTLGDFTGDWIVFWLGWTIGGVVLWPKILAEFTCAYLIGIVFQYFSIVPMRHLPPGKGLWAAVKADTLSIVAFEIGMFVWMLLVRFVFFHQDLPPTEPVYWFMMQIAMLLGFATSYPMNRWLIRQGWKEAM